MIKMFLLVFNWLWLLINCNDTNDLLTKKSQENSLRQAQKILTYALVLPNNSIKKINALSTETLVMTFSFWVKFIKDDDNGILLEFDQGIKIKFNDGIISIEYDNYVIFSYYIDIGKFIHVSVGFEKQDKIAKYTSAFFTVNRENILMENFVFYQKEYNFQYKKIILGSISSEITRMSIFPNYYINVYGMIMNKVIFPLIRDLIPFDLNCFPGYTCKPIYDQIFNSTAYPSDTTQTIIENSMGSTEIINCINSCLEGCSGKESTNCFCSSASLKVFPLYDPALKYINCSQKMYFDFHQYHHIEFQNIKCTRFTNPAIEFWHQMNVYSEDAKIKLAKLMVLLDNFFDIKIEYSNLPGAKHQVQCHFGMDTYKHDYKTGVWNHILCEYTNDNNLRLAINNITIGSDIFIENPKCDDSKYLIIQSHGGEFNDVESAWGSSFIRQFRIWNKKRDKAYQNVEINNKALDRELINLMFLFDSFLYKDEFIIIKGSRSIIQINMAPEEDKFHYSILSTTYYESKTLELRDEKDDFSYLIDLNKLKSNKFSEKSITPSLTGRYTIDFWINIQNIKELTEGINIIWEKHISISIVKNNTNQISYICFPQDYRDSPINMMGTQIIEKAASAYNSIYEEIQDDIIDNMWTYIRCAYSWDMEEAYLQLNENPTASLIKIMKHEMIYKNSFVDYILKYFFPENIPQSSLEIQLPNTKKDIVIAMRTLNLFTEYHPYNFPTSRILFNNEFKLNYHVLGINFTIDDNEELDAFTQDKSKSYKIPLQINKGLIPDHLVQCTINICDPNKYSYDSTSLQCIDKTTSKIPKDSRLSFNGRAIECNDKFHVNVQTLTCDSACNTNYYRSPGSNILSSICNYKCSDKHNCPFKATNQIQNDIECASKKDKRVGYKCISDLQNESKFFSFIFISCVLFRWLSKLSPNLS